jgi:uncharacterized protein GlcG (DUF336 family)
LTLAVAELIVARVLRKADELGCMPGAVAVVDAGGHVLLLKRPETVGYLYADMAISKAWSCTAIGRGAKQTGESAAKRNIFGGLAALGGGKFFPMPGGALIRNRAGTVLGAVGMGGPAGGANDELCVVAGVEAAGLVAEP